MQALGLVRISKKTKIVKISFRKISERKKMGLGHPGWKNNSVLGIRGDQLRAPVERLGPSQGFKKGPYHADRC